MESKDQIRLPTNTAAGAEANILDIAANRSARKWSPQEIALRAIWEMVRFSLFALSPRPLWAWRRLLLRAFGAKVGRHAHIYPSVKIALPWNITIGDYAAVGEGAILYSLGNISIGERTTISQYAHLCAGTHDYRQADMPLVKATIHIDSEVWICADAFVGPGVHVGRRAVLGARGVAMTNLAEGMIHVGNPAREVRVR